MLAARAHSWRQLSRSILVIAAVVSLVQMLLPLAQSWHLHDHAQGHAHTHAAHADHIHTGHGHSHDDHDHPAEPATPHGDERCPTCELFHGLKAATMPPTDQGPVRLTAAPGDWVHPSDLDTPAFLVPAEVRPRGPPAA
jgi:ABC-type nickel/cobalt efflux system permease component RcnA